MIDNENTEGGDQGQRKIGSQEKVTEALSQMGSLADVGDEHEGGCGIKGEADPLNEPCRQKGPERLRQKIGNGGKGKQENSGEHDGFFRVFHEGSSDKGPEGEGRDPEHPDENSDLSLLPIPVLKGRSEAWEEGCGGRIETSILKKNRE